MLDSEQKAAVEICDGIKKIWGKHGGLVGCIKIGVDGPEIQDMILKVLYGLTYGLTDDQAPSVSACPPGTPESECCGDPDDDCQYEKPGREVMKLNSQAKSIIYYLLRGYKKGYGVNLNDMEGDLEDAEYPEWLEAIKQLSEISASTQADYEIQRLERHIKARDQAPRPAGGE